MKVPARFPNIDDAIKSLSDKALLESKTDITDTKGRYLHWDKLRFLSPPEGFTSEQWWAKIKYVRRQRYRPIKITDPEGRPFVFLYTDKIMETLYWLDQNVLNKLDTYQSILNSQMKNTYLIHSLIEEAINSSQLEGAVTTLVVAKEMLRQKRKPSDIHEQMIYNNYAAMQFIREYKQVSLTPALLLELQRILTENTLENTNHAGCFRTEKEDVQVVNYKDDTVYVPPSAQYLPERIQKLCNFANNPNLNIFFHPIIKAIILHFLLGYEHPFVDGNGRTARALFYWDMAKHHYWLMDYISISKIIKKAPIQYGKAYLHTETDENDLTYFIEHQLDVIKKAVNDLYGYIDKKMQDIEAAEILLSSVQKLNEKLNYRQLIIIKHAIKNPGYIYTIAAHQNTHDIAYDTARIDLIQLSDNLNFLIKEKNGKVFIFKAPRDLINRIRKISDQ